MLNRLQALASVGVTAAILCSVAPMISSNAFAAKSYEVSGQVTRVTEDSVEIRSGDRVLEFDREAALAGMGRSADSGHELQVGDRVTIRYRMEAEKIGPARQQPGSVAPKEEALPSNVPQMDDRAFFSAKNEEAHCRCNG